MTSEARATAAETLPEEITGIVHVAPGHWRRYRIGHDSGDTFADDDDFDGVTLTIEVTSAEEGQWILAGLCHGPQAHKDVLITTTRTSTARWRRPPR